MAKKPKTQSAPMEVSNLKELQNLIESKFGGGSLMIGRGSIASVEVFSTGVAAIDKALGVCGLPCGRIIEIYGSESSGKTTTCLQFIAACQQHYFERRGRHGVAAFIDAEHALDPEWASKTGVDMDSLLFSQPDSGEQALQIVERLVASKLVDLVVVDSVAALAPNEELRGEIGDHHVGAQARMISQGMRKLRGVISNSGCTVIFINQVREKIGTFFGNPESTPGGRALKFYASIRGEISRGARLTGDNDTVLGFQPKIKIIKNKVAAPFTSAVYEICVGTKERPTCGIDCIASLLDVALEEKVCTKNSNFIKYEDITLGNGRKNALLTLYNDAELVAKIKEQTYNKLAGYVRAKAIDPEAIDPEALELGEADV